MSPTESTIRWLKEAVLGLGLCPFARAPFEEGRVRVVEGALESGAQEARRLLASDPSALETTLLVVTKSADDFLKFHAAAQALQARFAGELQVLTFHPEFLFGDAPEDEPGHATNRSPYPTLHLLREASVTVAVDEHPDLRGIWRRNIRVVSALSEQERERLRRH